MQDARDVERTWHLLQGTFEHKPCEWKSQYGSFQDAWEKSIGDAKEMDEDYFGMPDSAFQAAKEVHRGVLRAGCTARTQAEVAAWPGLKLTAALMDWMRESPSELTPSNEQIPAVAAVLESRDDANDLRELLAACREYLRQ